jgi:hypothetical protein
LAETLDFESWSYLGLVAVSVDEFWMRGVGGTPWALLALLLAEALGVSIGSAVLSVRRRVFDADDRPVQWLEGLYRPDRYEYQLEVSSIGDVDARVSMREEEARN